MQSISKHKLESVLNNLISSDNIYAIATDLVERELIDPEGPEFQEIVNLVWEELVF